MEKSQILNELFSRNLRCLWLFAESYILMLDILQVFKSKSLYSSIMKSDLFTGVKDPSSINPDTTLADLGLDSLMGTEIQQALERDFDLTLSSREIRLLTMKKLREIGSDVSAPSVSAASSKKEDSASSIQIEDSVEFVRYDPSQLVPTVCIVKLNNISNDKSPLFIVHPIEGEKTNKKFSIFTLELLTCGILYA